MSLRTISRIGAITLPLLIASPVLAQQAAGASPQGESTAAQSGAAMNLSRDQIVQLQQALNDHGFDAGEVDGVFGGKTIAALKRFQSKAGLQPTGLLDQQTLAL